MDEFESDWNRAHNQGRADTRAVLRSGEMTHEYAVKLIKGSFGLTFWVTAATGCWLAIVSHWPIWALALLFFIGWPVAALVWCAMQTGAIMLIWRARGVRPPNSN